MLNGLWPHVDFMSKAQFKCSASATSQLFSLQAQYLFFFLVFLCLNVSTRVNKVLLLLLLSAVTN